MTRLAVLIAALALAACGTPPKPEPQIVIQRVEVPVPVKCNAAAALGPEPSYPDTAEAIRAAPSLFERVQLLLAGRVQRIQRDAEKSAALSAC